MYSFSWVCRIIARRTCYQCPKFIPQNVDISMCTGFQLWQVNVSAEIHFKWKILYCLPITDILPALNLQKLIVQWSLKMARQLLHTSLHGFTFQWSHVQEDYTDVQHSSVHDILFFSTVFFFFFLWFFFFFFFFRFSKLQFPFPYYFASPWKMHSNNPCIGPLVVEIDTKAMFTYK